MYFDIDHFKAINDTYRHDAGDALLKAFSERVIATVREMDVFARLGGDEFALLLQDLRDCTAAEKVAQQLVEAMLAPFRIGAHTLMVTTSIGVAFFQQGSHADDVIKRRPGDVQGQARRAQPLQDRRLTTPRYPCDSRRPSAYRT